MKRSHTTGAQAAKRATPSLNYHGQLLADARSNNEIKCEMNREHVKANREMDAVLAAARRQAR